MQTISRRKIATYIADQLAAGKPADSLFAQAASYLIEHKKQNQVELLAHDIETALARDHGVVFTRVVSARELSASIIKKIEQFVLASEGAKQVEVSVSVDPSLLGGVVIRTPRAELDTTVRTQLNALKS